MESKSNKIIARNTIYLYFRAFISLVITLYTSRIILKELGIEDYGIYTVVAGMSSFMTIVSGTLSHAMCRFMSHEFNKSIERRIHVFCSCLNLAFLAIILCLIIFESIGIWFLNDILEIPVSRTFSANIAFQCSVFVFILNLVNVPYNSVIITNEDMGLFAYVTMIDVILKLIVAISLSIIHSDKLIVYSFLLILQAIIIRFIYIYICHRRYPECIMRFIWDSSLVKSMFSFIGWTFLGSITFVLRESGVNFLLNIFCGPTVNAARGISTQVTNNVSIFGDNFLQATVPQTIKHYASNNLKGMHELVNNSCRYSFLLLMVFSLPVLTYTDFILNLWLVNVPTYASSFIKIILLYCIVSICSKPLETAVRASGNIKYYQISYAFLEFLNIPISWLLLYNGHSPIVTAIVIVIIGCFCVLCRVYYYNKLISLSYSTLLHEIGYKLLLISVLSVVLFLVFSYLIPCNSLVSFLSNILILSLFNGVMLYYIGLKKNERLLLLNKLKVNL